MKWKRSRACSVTLVSIPDTASSVMNIVAMIGEQQSVRRPPRCQTRLSNCGGTPLRGRRSGAFDSPRTKKAISSAMSDSDPAATPGQKIAGHPVLRAEVREDSAERRPEDEAHPERGADDAHPFGAILRRGLVGDVGLRGADVRAARAGDDARRETAA